MGRGGAAPARLQVRSDHGHTQPGLRSQGQAVDPGRRRTAPQSELGGHIRHRPQGGVPDVEESPDLAGQGPCLFGGVDASAAHAQVDRLQQPVIAESAQVPPRAVEVEAGPEDLALLGPGILVHGGSGGAHIREREQDEVAQGDAEGLGDPHELQGGDLPLARLDARERGPLQAAAPGQRGLVEPGPQSHLPDPRTEFAEVLDRIHVCDFHTFCGGIPRLRLSHQER